MSKTQCDEETGEITYQPILNTETGEQEFTCTLLQMPPKKPFKIPTSYIKPTHAKIKISTLPSDSLSNSAVMASLFLLPTTVFFYPILSIVVVTVELILHIWAHKKNTHLENDELYYQSPLHVICKEFCGACKEENYKTRITKFYAARTDRIRKYVRRIVT